MQKIIPSHACPRDDFIQSGIESATTEIEPEVDLTRVVLPTPWEMELESISNLPFESQPVPPTTEPAHQLFEDNTREESLVVKTFIDVGSIGLRRSASLQHRTEGELSASKGAL